MIIRILIKRDRSSNDLIETVFSRLPNVQVLESTSINAKVATMIIDKQKILSIEMADSSHHDIVETAGLATYSNSQPTVQFSDSIFRLCGWLDTALGVSRYKEFLIFTI